MTVHSPAWQRWQETWRLSFARARMGLRLSRTHIIILAVSLYLVVLLLVYLHLAGQLAAIRYHTQALTLRWEELKIENAELEVRLAEKLSITSLAEWAETRGATVSTLPMPGQRLPRVARPAPPPPADTARSAPPTSPAPWRMWAQAFGFIRR